MIAIVNVSTRKNVEGWNDYQVQINQIPICRFRHRRKDGLAKCLELAAKAVKKRDLEKVSKIMEALNALNQ